MTTSVEDRKTFLLEGARLYDAMIRLTTNDVIRRYLAFRIIVNGMAFEDVIGNRANARFRQIRNVLLAHKQDPEFFAGYRAAEEITNSSISPLITHMTDSTPSPDLFYRIPELSVEGPRDIFSNLMPNIFEKYHADFLAGFRVINNHLCFTGSSVQEVSGGALSGVFYRYHSSMALFQLAQYVYSNTCKISELGWTTRHSKLDMLLHAQNIADSIFKDFRNPYSIEGLLEVMTSERLGDASGLAAIKADANFANDYESIRRLRNKLVGHMDTQSSLTGLLAELDAFPIDCIDNLVNKIDQAVCDASRSHIAINVRYSTGNQPINNSQIVDMLSLTPPPYFGDSPIL